MRVTPPRCVGAAQPDRDPTDPDFAAIQHTVAIRITPDQAADGATQLREVVTSAVDIADRDPAELIVDGI